MRNITLMEENKNIDKIYDLAHKWGQGIRA